MQCYLDPVKAHLPSGVRATEHIQLVCPERTRGLLSDLKDPTSRAVLSKIQLRPTFHRVSELLTLSSRYALKGHEDYDQDFQDPSAVQFHRRSS